MRGKNNTLYLRKKAVEESGILKPVLKELFPEAQKTDKDQLLVKCPFHDDTNPSCSVNLECGLYNCFACGSAGNFFDLYMKVKNTDFMKTLTDLEQRAGIANTGGSSKTVKVFPKVVATFYYHNESGDRLYWKKRYEPGFGGTRKKSFAFYHKDKNGKEVKGRGGDPLLYNLHLLVNTDPNQPVFIVEGEAKADLLVSWDLVATTLDSGGQSGKGSSWRDGFEKYFTDRDVIILPDNDDTGEQYAKSISDRIFDVAKSVKILRLPGLPKKGDVIDWFESQQQEANVG